MHFAHRTKDCKPTSILNKTPKPKAQLDESMDEHYLSAYLEETLPEIGLDYETYGPYVTGLFPTTSDGGEEDNFEDVEEEINNIIELLQSSSETHSDDEQCWIQLKNEITHRTKAYNNEQWKRNVSVNIKTTTRD